jgi:hypothetical protein
MAFCFDQIMDETEKLRRLLSHWIEHNSEHALIYKGWAEKALSLDNEELSETLELLFYETMSLNMLFEKAIKISRREKL